MQSPDASTNALRPLKTGGAGQTEALAGKQVAVIGYGNQGRANALNLRDSGVQVTVGARAGGPGFAAAQADGFAPLPPTEAANRGNLVILALPDEAHAACWSRVVAPGLQSDAIVGFLHGFSVHHGLVKPAMHHGVVMVAPKGPGRTLRERFVEGLGIPALFAVHQGGRDAAHTRAVALAWAAGIGSARAALVETTFATECETDLFGEQAVLCGGMMALVQAAFDTLVQAGYPPEIAYMECCQELKQIADLVFERGPSGMRAAISNTAEFGAFEAGERLVDDAMRAKLRAILADIRGGAFGARFAADAAADFPWMRAKRAAADDDPIEAAGRGVRAWMPWLDKRKDPK